MTALFFDIPDDHLTISAYVSARATNLVSDGDSHTVTMDTDDLDDASAFSGFTADATNFVKFIVEAGREHGGQAGSGNRVIDKSALATVFRPVSTCDNMKFDGLGVQASLSVYSIANGCEGVEIRNCFFESTSTTVDIVAVGGAASINSMRNTFLLGGNDCLLAVADMEIEFCTALGASNRCYVLGKQTNCIGMDATNDDFSQESSGTNYNLDSDGTADGANSIDGSAIASSTIFVSVTDGSEDLNLLNNTNEANGAGIAISGITTDYEGTTRADPPDMGADEFVVAAGGILLRRLASVYERHNLIR